jgi:peptidoglycan/xylan/chitin deacetylase (PgdA/CDA1 family)
MSHRKSHLLKSTIKVLAAATALLIILIGIFYFYARNYYYDIPVLMYHHVKPSEKDSSLIVSPERFRDQMEFLARFNYDVITPSEYLQYIEGEKEIRRRNLVLITFDDGYRNNYTYAFPALKEYALPAVIFIVVDEINQEGYLNQKQIAKMQEKDVIFGSHTLSHVYLPSLKTEELIKEIKLSKEKLEEIAGKEIDFFAYPIGGYTEEAQRVLKEAGFLAAFTTNGGEGPSWRNDDIFALRRVKVTDRDNRFKLWAKLTGIYNIFRNVKDPH